MKRAGIGAVVLIAILAVTALAHGSKLALSEGLRHTIDLIERTAATIAPNDPVSQQPGSAELAKATALRNNHSFADHSNSRRYPGYNDCDSWRNIIDDGWSASYGKEIPVHGVQDARQLLQQTQQFWASQGYTVQMSADGGTSSAVWSTQLWTDTGNATIRFTVDQHRSVASIKGDNGLLASGMKLYRALRHSERQRRALDEKILHFVQDDRAAFG